MSFINRTDGKITGVFARPQHEGQEWIEDGDGELTTFRNPPPTNTEIYEKKIQAKIREMAIANLGAELPDGYK